MRITVSKEPSERGLARVCQSVRGKIIKVDGKEVATVSPLGRLAERGWCFYGRIGSSAVNTCNNPIATMEEAVEAAKAWIRSQYATIKP